MILQYDTLCYTYDVQVSPFRVLVDNVISFLPPRLWGRILPIANVLSALLWYFAMQFVSAAVDGAGSEHVDRDTTDRQVPAVHVHPRLDLCHHVRVRAEPHTENVLHSHDAFVRS